MSSTNPKIDALDFDGIKANLIEYLKTQDQFKDYDFEGAGMSVLLDVLAVNAHYQGYYANMVANETFLDSANLRRNVVSIAKHLNYVPKSYKSAVAYVDVEFLNLSLNPDILEQVENGNYFIERGDRFSTNTGTQSFVFTATTDTRVEKEGSRYFARNVEIKEGTRRTITYVYDNSSDIDQKFPIPDINVDIDEITVRVGSSVTDNTGIEDIWTRVSDINKVSSESQVYFIQQNQNINYEIYFGDGIVGKKPTPGNVISISYIITSGSQANNIGKNETSSNRTFKYAEYASSVTSLVLDESTGKPSPTFGGSELESLTSVKYYAPRNYQAQERAVTAEDYRVLLAKSYGEQADSVFIWGGEDNDPPIYGKVFVSIKPKNAEKLTQPQKLAIAKNILKEKNVVSITPEIVDPDYLYLVMDLTVKYDSSKTTLTSETLATAIGNLVYSYSLENIGKFDRSFMESQFLTYINNNYAPPVLSSRIDLSLVKRLEPNLATIATYAINFDNELFHPTDGYDSILETTAFMYQDSTNTATVPPNVEAYCDDDGYGNVRIYKLVSGVKVYLNETAGTINYTTGKITLVNFAPQSLSPETQTDIAFTVIPASRDIESRRNQIILVEREDISVTAVPQTLRYDPYSASGSSFRGNN